MDKSHTDKSEKDTAATKTSDGKKFTTYGQRVHKWGTYISVDWIWNYISGIAWASWGRYTEIGRTVWARPAKAAATWVAGSVFKMKGPALDKSVGNVVAFLSVIAGGTIFTIPPLMVLEDKKRKKSIVKWLDEKHYGKDVVANDPRFAKAYDDMDHEAKKGFWAGQISRFVSLAPLLATVMLETPFKKTKWYFDAVGAGSAKTYNAVGITKKRLYGEKPFPLDKKRPGELTTPDAEWTWLHENSAIDFGLEPWYAMFHMVTYGFFSKIMDRKKPEPAHEAKQKSESSQQSEVLKAKHHANQHDGPLTKVGHISREAHLANVAQVHQY